MPSQFSHEILNANPFAYLDDAPLEERRARAVSMRRTLPEAVLTEIGRLDPQAIAQVRQEAWPDVRDADELEDTLQTLVALREDYSPPEDEKPWASSGGASLRNWRLRAARREPLCRASRIGFRRHGRAPLR